MTEKIRSGYATHVGNVRDHNEDNYRLNPELGLWIVADGMGGHESGEVASAMTVDIITQAIEVGESLKESLVSAHEAVLYAAKSDPRKSGMGSTVVVLRIQGNRFEIAGEWIEGQSSREWFQHLKSLGRTRHLKIDIRPQREAAGKGIEKFVSDSPSVHKVPDWFIWAVTPEPLTFSRTISLSDGTERRLLIQADPDDEIVEAWNEALDRTSLAAAESIAETCDHLFSVLRNLLRRLHPLILDELGLKASLDDMLELWSAQQSSIFLQYRCDPEVDEFSVKLRIHIFRTVQECMTNILKHACATRVSVRIQVLQQSSDSRLQIEIADDGLGFDSKAVNTGFGLRGIRERVEGLGGKTSIRTAPGDGVRIDIDIPFARAAA